MKLLITLLFSSGAFAENAPVDYFVWNSPIVLTGTCSKVAPDGRCSEINAWHIYKGKAEIPDSVMKAPGKLGDSVMTSIDASQASRFGLHQTRILYGHIDQDVFVLEPQVNNVFMKNLDRTADLVRLQKSNPGLTMEEVFAAGYDISFPVSGKNTIISIKPGPVKPVAEKPVAEKPDVEKPAVEEPVEGLAYEEEISDEEPVIEQPVAIDESEFEVPVVERPLDEKPVIGEILFEKNNEGDSLKTTTSSSTTTTIATSTESEIAQTTTSMPKTTSNEFDSESDDEIYIITDTPSLAGNPEVEIPEIEAVPITDDTPITVNYDPDSAITEESGPSCTWGSWEEWGPCDCSEGVRRRKMEGFGSGPDCKTKIATSQNCDQECKEEPGLSTNVLGSGDFSGDFDSDDSDFDRDDQSEFDRADKSSEDLNKLLRGAPISSELFRTTRDRYRKSVDDFFEENESSELYIKLPQTA